MKTKIVRINKYLSLCGVTSRRGADTLISEKRVTINDVTVEQMGQTVDIDTDVVKVDGTIVELVEQKVYILFNKPQQVMTTLNDPFKRKTVLHFLKDLPIRVYPVGRLDFDTEGVLLLTNDGDLAYQLTHPKFQIEKIYDVKVDGHFTEAGSQAIAKGIKLEDGAIGKGKVHIIGRIKNFTNIRITLTEGRKREVKQLCKGVGHNVLSLRRINFAGITAEGLNLGKWRYLKSDEIELLRNTIEQNN